MNSLSVNPKINNHQISQLSFKGTDKNKSNDKTASGVAGAAGLTTSGLIKGFPKAQKMLPQFLNSVKQGCGVRKATILQAAGKYCNNPLVRFVADIVAIGSMFDIANSIKNKGKKAYNNVA